MLRATANRLLPTTITGSLPRPSWYTENLGLKSFLVAMVETRFREQYEDALAVYLSEQTVAGLDIVTDGDVRFTQDIGGQSFNIVGNVNDTTLPVRVNNAGQNDRDLAQLSFKLDYDTDFGTFTSITSDADAPLRWIAGAYFIATDRYISTGNIMDRGEGAFPVYRTPRGNFPLDTSVYANSAQITFLADSQNNSAWAVFGELAYDLTDRTELAFALRYDEDKREQTTLTPTPFLPNVPGFPQGFTGEVRTNTWSESQPRLTLRFEPSDNLTLFGGYSKGFRSGGFNQTGVGPLAASLGIAGVGDLFDAEVAETLELGLKSQFADNRVNLNFSVFDTEAEGSYFFVFIAQNSTQNLGNLAEVDYKGFELDLNARLAGNFDVFFGYGDTDSEIVRSATPSDIGNQAPLVSESTVNVGAQYQRPLGNLGLELFLRADYQRIGKTYWDPANSTVRDPVNLLDLRAGANGDGWLLIAWQKNFNDVVYNAEFSPGGFVFKAKPRR